MRTLVLAACLCCAANSFAEKPKPEHATRRYVLRELKIEGTVTAAQQKLLQDRIWSAVEFTLSMRTDDLVHLEDRNAAINQHPRTQGCLEPRCQIELGDALAASRVLTVAVTRRGPAGDAGDWAARVESFAVDGVRTVGATDLPCGGCTTEQLIGKINDALEPLLNADVGAPLCSLHVESVPGASVSVDGTALGDAPFAHSVFAGVHQVAVDKPGWTRNQAQVECAAGSTQAVNLAPHEPAAVARAVEAPRRSPALKIVGGLLVGLGVAAIVTGVVALAFDKQGACDRPSGQAQCPKLYDSGATGAALIGAGAAAAVGGTVTLLIDHLRGRRSSVAVVLQPLPSGAWAALRTQF